MIRVIKQIENTCKTAKKPSGYVTYLVECSNCLKQYPMLKKNVKKIKYCVDCTHLLSRKPPELKARQPKRHLHYMHGTHFYHKWTSMLGRCNYPTVHGYKNYGGRGIKCEWKCFEDFYKDMYESYLDHYRIHGVDTTLDRIDVNGNYNKDNCRWLTMLEQQSGKRNNHKTLYKGEVYPTLKGLCEKYGRDYHTVCGRLKRGWDIERAIDEPILSQ